MQGKIKKERKIERGREGENILAFSFGKQKEKKEEDDRHNTTTHGHKSETRKESKQCKRNVGASQEERLTNRQ